MFQHLWASLGFLPAIFGTTITIKFHEVKYFQHFISYWYTIDWADHERKAVEKLLHGVN